MFKEEKKPDTLNEIYRMPYEIGMIGGVRGPAARSPVCGLWMKVDGRKKCARTRSRAKSQFWSFLICFLKLRNTLAFCQYESGQRKAGALAGSTGRGKWAIRATPHQVLVTILLNAESKTVQSHFDIHFISCGSVWKWMQAACAHAVSDRANYYGWTFVGLT